MRSFSLEVPGLLWRPKKMLKGKSGSVRKAEESSGYWEDNQQMSAMQCDEAAEAVSLLAQICPWEDQAIVSLELGFK